MERSKTILDKTLIVLGFNLFQPVSGVALLASLTRRAILIGCEITLIAMFMFEVFTDAQLPVGDKMFMLNISIVFASMLVQVVVVTSYRGEIVEIFKAFERSFRKRSNLLVEGFSNPLFNRCGEILYKISCVQLFMAVTNLIAVTFTPWLSNTKLIYPMEFVIVRNHPRWNDVCNYLIQEIGGGFVCIFFGFFSLIFIIFTIGILYELKLIGKLCSTVGDEEGSSSVLLKLIINMHLEALNVVQRINKIFSSSILIWETLMITASLMLFILSMIDRGRMAAFTLACSICITQYLMVSLLSALVKDALLDIGVQIYMSKWYLLPVDDRRSIMMILLMAQRSKTLRVGIFGDASLDRFTDTCKLVYRLCLAVKVMIEKYGG